MPKKIAEISPRLGDQRFSFEELVCQVVLRTDAAGSDTWMRLHGDGGDGGVEAYWYPKPGEMTGIQAKYFAKSGDIDWGQVRSSFETAIKVYADLREYRIYLACDLTGPTAKPGTSGVEKWEAAERAMKAAAQQLGRDVAIRLYPANVIRSALTRPECAGLAAYFYGEIEITRARLAEWQAKAATLLGERYHPDEHVDTDVEDVLRSLQRPPESEKALLSLLDDVRAAFRLDIPASWADDVEKKVFLAAAPAIEELLACIPPKELSTPWPIDAWTSAVDQATAKLAAIETLLWSQADDDRSPSNDLRHVRMQLSKLQRAVRAFGERLESAAVRVEAARCALVVGPAGSGKSHVLAHLAGEIVGAGGVALLLLGQRLTSQPLWPHIAQLLDTAGQSGADILGALDAAACASQRRGLVILDALNEGPLRNTWLTEFEAFVDEVLKYKHLAVVVSCRDVFAPFVLSDRMRSRFPMVEVRGFESDAEQEAAARQFLDRKGIARPPSPWWAPELINPLFLRSCAGALEAAGLREFPKGLSGTKQLLAFYLSAVSRGLGTQWDGGDTLAAPTKLALTAIAERMAALRQDWLERDAAAELASAAFKGFTAPAHQSWLDVLLGNGVLREDPHPGALASEDPLDDRPDVVRFAFQRFQEHLLAATLLAGIKDVAGAFQPGGPLAFAVSEYGGVYWEWNGLIEALSIQMPETHGVELIDVMPGGFDDADYSTGAAFFQSVKWRSADAVSDRTLEIANALSRGDISILDLLIELSPRTDHPWNADMLNRNLRRWKLPERDRLWTQSLSFNGLVAGHPADRLIEWCATAPKPKADPEMLRLCSVALAWMLTSSSPGLRDQATKSLSSLFTDAPDLFPRLLAQFVDVDDPYVIERIAAAGFGALARRPDAATARLYAEAAWDHVLASGAPPPCVMLRDYCRAIIDIAEGLGALPARIDAKRARPPYSSVRPSLNVSEEKLKAIAAAAGGEQILHSCGWMGDFNRYEVEPAVRLITRTPLTKPPPTTPDQMARSFESEVIDDWPERDKALAAVRAVLADGWVTRIVPSPTGGVSVRRLNKTKDRAWKARLARAEAELFALLDEAEQTRFQREWTPAHYRRGWPPRERPATFPTADACRWIARRAYSLGWTKTRFGQDNDRHDGHSRQRAAVERIGKKYQWIARTELLARLSDRYWLANSYGDAPTAYATSLDLSFERDIDPTIFPHHAALDGQAWGRERGLTPDDIVIAPADGDARLRWPFEGDPASDAAAKTSFKDSAGEGWTRLAWYISAERRRQQRGGSHSHGRLQHEFFFTYPILTRRGDGVRLMKSLRAGRHVDIMEWQPDEHIDGLFLYELCASGAVADDPWRWCTRKDIGRLEIARPTSVHAWESVLDCSLPDGARASVLSPWLMQSEGLRLSPASEQLTLASDGGVIAWSAARGDGVAVRTDWWSALLDKRQLDCVWITTGEREAWRDDDDAGAAAWRRFHAVEVWSGQKRRSATWNEDRPRGLSSAA